MLTIVCFMEAITMAKVEPEMKARLSEEINKLGWSTKDIAEELLCSKNAVVTWKRGSDFPTITHLRDLYEIGCDIMYIITGERTRGGDADV